MSLHFAPMPALFPRTRPVEPDPITPLSESARQVLVENHARVREFVARTCGVGSDEYLMLGLDSDPEVRFDLDAGELARLRESF